MLARWFGVAVVSLHVYGLARTVPLPSTPSSAHPLEPRVVEVCSCWLTTITLITDSAVSMLVQRCRRWPDIETTLGQCLMAATQTTWTQHAMIDRRCWGCRRRATVCSSHGSPTPRTECVRGGEGGVTAVSDTVSVAVCRLSQRQWRLATPIATPPMARSPHSAPRWLADRGGAWHG